MNKVAYLVTAEIYEEDHPCEAGLEVVGIFSTKEKAQRIIDKHETEYVEEEDFFDFKYSITKMSFDLPYDNDEFEHYPESHYFE